MLSANIGQLTAEVLLRVFFLGSLNTSSIAAPSGSEKISDFFRAVLLFGYPLGTYHYEEGGRGIREGGNVFLAHFERILVAAVIVFDCIGFFIIVVLGLREKRERKRFRGEGLLWTVAQRRADGRIVDTYLNTLNWMEIIQMLPQYSVVYWLPVIYFCLEVKYDGKGFRWEP